MAQDEKHRMETRKCKTVLRAGFEDDFTVFYAARITQITESQEDDEQVEWIDDPERPPKIFRANTVVLTGLLSLLSSLLLFAK